MVEDLSVERKILKKLRQVKFNQTILAKYGLYKTISEYKRLFDI